MSNSQIDSQFEDLNQRLFKAFQAIGKLLGQLSEQVKGVQTDVEALRGRQGEPSSTGESTLLARSEFIHAMQLIGQQFQQLSRQVTESRGGDGVSDTALQSLLAQIHASTDSIVETHSYRVLQSLDASVRHETEAAGQIDARLEGLDSQLRQLAEQAARSGAADSALQELSRRFDALEMLLRQEPEPSTGVVEAVSELSTRLDAIAGSLGMIQAGFDEAQTRGAESTVAALDTLSTRVEGIGTALGSLAHRFEAFSPEQLQHALTTQSDRIDAIQATLEATADRITAAAPPPDLPERLAAVVEERLARDREELPEQIATAVKAQVPTSEELLRALQSQVPTAADFLEAFPEEWRAPTVEIPPPVVPEWAADFPNALAEVQAGLAAVEEKLERFARSEASPDWVAALDARLQELARQLQERPAAPVLATGDTADLGADLGQVVAILVEHLARDREALSERVAAAVQAHLPAAADLREAMAAAGSALKGEPALPSAPPDWVTDLPDSLAQVEARLAQLDEKLEQLARPANAAEPLAALDARLQELAKLWEERSARPAPEVADPDEVNAAHEQLASILARLDELATQVDQIPESVRPEAQIEEPAYASRLEALLTHVDASLGQLAAAPAPADAEVGPHLESLSQKLDALSEQIQPPKVEAPAEPSEPEWVSRLEERLATLSAPAEPPAVDLTPLEQRLAALEVALRETTNRDTVQAPAALEAFDKRLQAIEERLSRLAPVDATPAVQSLEQRLQERLNQIEAAVRRISIVPPRPVSAASPAAPPPPPAKPARTPATPAATASTPAEDAPPAAPAAAPPAGSLDDLFQLPKSDAAPSLQGSRPAPSNSLDDLTDALLQSYGFEDS